MANWVRQAKLGLPWVAGTAVGLGTAGGLYAYCKSDMLLSHRCKGLYGNYVVEIKERVPESWHPWSAKHYVPLAFDEKTTFHGCCTGTMCTTCGHVKSTNIYPGNSYLRDKYNYLSHYPLNPKLKPWVMLSEINPKPLDIYLGDQQLVNMTDFLNESRNVVNTKSD